VPPKLSITKMDLVDASPLFHIDNRMLENLAWIARTCPISCKSSFFSSVRSARVYKSILAAIIVLSSRSVCVRPNSSPLPTCCLSLDQAQTICASDSRSVKTKLILPSAIVDQSINDCLSAVANSGVYSVSFRR